MDVNALISEYISIPIILFCLCVGFVLKNGLSSCKIDKWIPLILGILGVVCNVWYSQTFDYQIILVGFFSGLASTGFYELFHQFIKNMGGTYVPNTTVQETIVKSPQPIVMEPTILVDSPIEEEEGVPIGSRMSN